MRKVTRLLLAALHDCRLIWTIFVTELVGPREEPSQGSEFGDKLQKEEGGAEFKDIESLG